MQVFADRIDGGRELAKLLESYRGQDVVVYGLPRGGVVTAKVVADYLDAPLDLIITRKIGHPGNPEYAIGAITDDGDMALNDHQSPFVPQNWLANEEQVQLAEARRRRTVYVGDRPDVPVEGKIAILVDDGIATGYTMEAAIRSVRKRRPEKVVVAAPVAPENTIDRFRRLADDVVIVETPEVLIAIGQWYENFSAVEDEDVLNLMKERVRT